MIPLNEMIHGGFYRLDARNFSYGIYFDGEGFVGIRTKFHDMFLDIELHWEADDHYGTAKPLEYIEMYTGELWHHKTVGNKWYENEEMYNWLEGRCEY